LPNLFESKWRRSHSYKIAARMCAPNCCCRSDKIC
jgi:hypothetical protein